MKIGGKFIRIFFGLILFLFVNEIGVYCFIVLRCMKRIFNLLRGILNRKKVYLKFRLALEKMIELNINF